MSGTKVKFAALMVCAATVGYGGSALAQSAGSAAVSAQASAIPAGASVTAFYNTWRASPIWFRGTAPKAEVNQLIAILQRAPFDGFAVGPQLAAGVQAAVQRAASGNPADQAAAEHALSTAWVQYVQAVKKTTPGMIYAYPVLAPQGTRADQILLTAAAAPSLQQHLANVSAVNPLYAQLRDAAWAQAQAGGNPVPDQRLLANLDRIRSLPATGRFIMVDSGDQTVSLYENGRRIDSMKVIVGTNDMPTPLIASVMHYVTFNPYWNAPHHIVRQSIAPNALRQGQSYLKTRGYEVMAEWTTDSATVAADSVDWKAVAAGKKKIRVRQKPGPGNFMGILKFPFPNPEDIYLHDTPNKALFNKAQRNLSNGCVRVEDAARLGRWLLGRDPVAPGPEPEIRVQIPTGVPIYLTYLTAQVKDGQLSYRSDFYGWDRPQSQLASIR